MRTEHRLKKSKDFVTVQRHGKTLVAVELVLKTLRNGETNSRCGFSVSKKVGCAAKRNKLKRRLRAIMPLESVAGGWDMVFIVRKGAVNSSYSRLQESVYDLLKRAGLMNGDINNDSIGQND